MVRLTSAQKAIHPVAIYIVCSIAGIALGIFLSQSYVDWLAYGKAVDWEKLPAPPSHPTGLLEADLCRIYIQTEQGIYISTGIEQCLKSGEEPCWSLVDKIDLELLYRSPCGSSPSFYETPVPPLTYSQSLMVQECGPDYFSEIHYILGHDGGIWFWRHGSYAPGIANVMLLACCIGVSLGLFSGLFLANRFIVYLRKRG